MTEMRLKYAAAPAFAPAVDAGDRLAIPGWASAPVVDRSKEVVVADDLELAEYELNPVLLFCHQRNELPVGRAVGLWVKGYGNGFNGLWCDAFEFNPNYQKAVDTYEAYRGSFMRGFSIGFLPYGWRPLNPSEAERLGWDAKDRANRMTRGKLLEVSCVPIPDNQLALAVPVVKSVLAAVPDDMRRLILDATPPQSTFAADLSKVRPGFPPAEKQSHLMPSSHPTPAPSEVPAMAEPTAAEAVETTDTPAPAAQPVTKAADAPAKAEPQKVDITVTIKQEQPAPAEKAAAAAPETPAEAPAEKAADEPTETPAPEAVEKAEGGKMTPGAMAYHTACCGMKAALADGMAHAEMSDHEGVKKSFGRMAERVCKAAGKGCMKAAGYFPDHAEAFKAMAQEFGQSDAEPDDDEGDGDTPEKKPEPEKSLDVAELVTKAVEEQFAPLATKDEVNALRADIADLKDGFLEFLASQVKR